MPKADLHQLADEYRAEFPIFRSATYLNSCSLGALSQRSREALTEFADLWERINGKDSWASNPWVWVVSFKRVVQGNTLADIQAGQNATVMTGETTEPMDPAPVEVVEEP